MGSEMCIRDRLSSVLHEWTIPHTDLNIVSSPLYLPISIHRISPLFARAKGTHQITIEILKSDALISSSDSNHFVLETPYIFEYKPDDVLTCSEKVLNQDFECFFALNYQEIELKLGSAVVAETETKFGKAIVIKDFGNILNALTILSTTDVVLINFEIGLIPAPESEILIQDFVFSIYNK